MRTQVTYTISLACLAIAWLASPSVHAKQVKLDVAMAQPTMLLCDRPKCDNHLRIALEGFEMEAASKRLAVNIAIVIDRSGSMQGEKIKHAREAALQAIDRLRDSDIVSIVAYDTSVEVLVPATKLTDREDIKRRIRDIKADGNTALFAGVSKGAAEVRKFLDDKHVNRVILLSDGLANVGPSSPMELGQLGRSLIKEGISVSTMGLGTGYNEDLMSKLAIESSGNHTFIEAAQDLIAVFQREFDDVLSVVAQQIVIEAKMASGVRPVKVLNYPGNIDGQMVTIDLGQLYARQQRYFVVEVEIEKGENGSSRPVAEVAVTYKNAVTETTDKLTSSVQVKFTDSKEIAEKSINKEVLASCVLQIANQRNQEATLIRDRGDIAGAERLLKDNGSYLESNYRRLGVPELKSRAVDNMQQADKLSDKDWNVNRKSMRGKQALDTQQQSYSGKGEKTPK